MVKFGKSVVKKSRGNLTRERANASKTLWNSIRFKWKANVMDFFMEYYGAFLDKGVTGTGKLHLSKTKVMPVPYNKSEASPEYKFRSGKKAIGGNLKNWLSVKGIPVSAEFPIRRSIHARGIRPRRFFTTAFNDEADKFEDEISRAIGRDVDEHLTDILKRM